MDIESFFATDADAEENGRWFDIGPKAKIKLRSFSSAKSKEVRRKLERPYAAILRTGKNLSDEINEGIAIKQMAEAIIVDWRGLTTTVTDAEGNVSQVDNPYSQGACLELLNASSKFRDFIAQVVINDDSFKPEDRDDGVKN